MTEIVHARCVLCKCEFPIARAELASAEPGCRIWQQFGQLIPGGGGQTFVQISALNTNGDICPKCAVTFIELVTGRIKGHVESLMSKPALEGSDGKDWFN